MPMPAEHKQQLAQEAGQMPEQLRTLASDPKFIAAFDKLHDDENALSEFKKDTIGWLRKQGVDLPPDARVEVRR